MGRAHFPRFLLFTCAILTAKYVVTLSFNGCKAHFPLFLPVTCAILAAQYVLTLSFCVCKAHFPQFLLFTGAILATIYVVTLSFNVCKALFPLFLLFACAILTFFQEDPGNSERKSATMNNALFKNCFYCSFAFPWRCSLWIKGMHFHKVETK